MARDYGKVNFVKFSDQDEPNLGVWMNELELELEAFKPDIVVCHSLANALWFHLCNAHNIRVVEKLFLVAPPSLNTQIDELKSFFPVNPPKDLYAKYSLLVTSTNDPYMNEKEAEELQKALNVTMEVIKDGGHLISDSAYGEWEWILQEVKKSF